MRRPGWRGGKPPAGAKAMGPRADPRAHGASSATRRSGSPDRNLPRTGPLGLRHRDREDPVLEGGRHLFGIDRGRQREAPLEGAVAPLVAVHPLGALLGLLLLLA